jgi:hypothetical protein
MPISRAYCRFYMRYFYHIPKLYAKASYDSQQNYLGEDTFPHIMPKEGNSERMRRHEQASAAADLPSLRRMRAPCIEKTHRTSRVHA